MNHFHFILISLSIISMSCWLYLVRSRRAAKGKLSQDTPRDNSFLPDPSNPLFSSPDHQTAQAASRPWHKPIACEDAAAPLFAGTTVHTKDYSFLQPLPPPQQQGFSFGQKLRTLALVLFLSVLFGVIAGRVIGWTLVSAEKSFAEMLAMLEQAWKGGQSYELKPQVYSPSKPPEPGHLRWPLTYQSGVHWKVSVKGAEFITEGGVDLYFDPQGTLHLSEGKLVVKGGFFPKGLVIETPSARVVRSSEGSAAGTLGVEASPSKTDVVVFSGHAKVSPKRKSTGETTLSSRQGIRIDSSHPPTRLIRVESGDWKLLPPASEH